MLITNLIGVACAFLGWKFTIFATKEVVNDIKKIMRK